jgi:alkane 1-monooxygenase
MEQWTDHKRYLWLFGLVVPLFPFMGGGLATLTGWSVFWFIGPILILGLIPAIDLAAGIDRSNPPDDLIATLEADKYYRWITYFFLPLQYLALIWACWLWAGDTLSVVDKVGLALTVGTVAGVGINTAHELGHKKEKVERWLAKIALAQSFYGHFYIEHNRGHHVRVATPVDPASSRVGESLYAFCRAPWSAACRAPGVSSNPASSAATRATGRIRNDVLNAWLMSWSCGPYC